MFCKKCGSQLKDNAKFCGVCGTPVEVATPAAPVADPFAQAAPVAPAADPFAQAAPVAPQYNPMPQGTPIQPAQQWGPMMTPAPKNKKSKTPLFIGIGVAALIAVIILVVVLVSACSGGGASTPEDAVNAYFEALNNKDFGDFEDIMYPAFIEETFDEELYSKSEFIDKFVQKANPDDGKVTFSNVKVTEKSNASSSEISEANSMLKSYDSYIKIEKMAEVEGTVKIKTEDDTATYEFEATVVKAGGDWYIIKVSVETWYPIDED